MEETKEVKKLSYEELENMCNRLYIELQNANMVNMFKRLDYLFKVVEFKNSFSKEFAEMCIREVESLMTVTAEEPKTDE